MLKMYHLFCFIHHHTQGRHVDGVNAPFQLETSNPDLKHAHKIHAFLHNFESATIHEETAINESSIYRIHVSKISRYIFSSYHVVNHEYF